MSEGDLSLERFAELVALANKTNPRCGPDENGDWWVAVHPNADTALIEEAIAQGFRIEWCEGKQ